MKQLLIFILALFGMSSCIIAQDKHFSDMDVAAFSKFIKNDDVQLLDVRTPEEYAEGHIQGATNINVFDSDFIEQCQKSLKKDEPVAVYCRSGKRSADAAQQLAANGYKVTNLLGGILAWKEDGKPINP